MRNCQEIRDSLSFYLDDCLESDEKAQVEKHLEHCPECQLELEELQETINMFASLNEEELVPPASFRRELRKKLEKEQRPSKVSYFYKFVDSVNKSTFKSWIPMAAAALLLIVMVPVIMYGFGSMGAKGIMEEAKMDEPQSYSLRNTAEPEMAMDMAKEKMAEAPKLKAGSVAKGLDQGAAPVQMERKIIKTGYLSLEVDNYKSTAAEINALVREMRGYVVNEDTHIYDRQRKLLAGNMTVRIPQERFDEALNRLEEMGTFDNRSVDAQDVTEEFVDIESRLRAMRLKEERLLAILNKSGNLGDVLAVENELARTRADLEALQGRLRYLNNRTELSTIDINIRESLTPVKQIKTTGLEGVLDRFQRAFIKSINSIIIGTGNLIVYLGAYLPFLLMGTIVMILLWFVLRKIWIKYKDKAN